MKTHYFFQSAVIIFFTLIIFGCRNTRQGKHEHVLDSVAVGNMINSQSFVFIPLYVSPMSGGKSDLSSGFEITISKDSIISYLPFFGRGYSAPISPADVDYHFTSTNFTYTVLSAKKGWNISLKPKDQKSLQELYFRIFDNASASLTITSVDRSIISFTGYIKERLLSGSNK